MKQFIKNLLNKRLNNEKGLTLIELLAVIVILAIIAAIAIPAIGNIINNSEIKAAKADAINILSAGNLYFTDNPNVDQITYTPAIGDAAATYAPANFSTFIQSLGSFEDVTFEVYNNAGRVSFYGVVTAGGQTITFGTDGTGLTLDQIDAGSANADDGTTMADA